MAERNAKTRPLIGVTGPDQGGWLAWRFTRYALYRAGARAWRLTPREPEPPADLAGLVIGGGDDIDPARYGEVSTLETRIDQNRDTLEWEMLALAQHQQMPVLGICRGAQLLNVFYGGNLHQDLKAVFQHLVLRKTILPRKRIRIVPDTHLADITGTIEIKVNSLHHQAVKRLAGGFRVSASDTDDIVQAIEATEYPCRIGVQWHPEYLPQSRTQQQIFTALVQTAGQYAANAA